MNHLKFIIFIMSVFTIGFTLGKKSNQQDITNALVEFEDDSKRQQTNENSNAENTIESIQSDERDELLAKLEQQILSLEAQLIAKNDPPATQEYYPNLEQAPSNRAKNKQEQVNNSIKREEIGDNLPSPFLEIVLDMEGDTVDMFRQFQSETVDYEWSILMMQNITDYIITHELQGGVELQSVICKSSVCEIRGFHTDMENRTWDVIFAGMALQRWWDFTNIRGTEVLTEQSSGYFYLLMQNMEMLTQ